MRPVVYLAHPVAGDVAANVQRALRWLAWLRKREPNACVIAPWIASILAGEQDSDPAQRERGMLDAEAICARVDRIVLVGGRVSSGMEREVVATMLGRGTLEDLTHLGDEPPTGEP